ncbi:acyl-CoA carboxylase subunit epsilon [Frigoribacterium salinisoli]
MTGAEQQASADPAGSAVLRVVAGSPTPEELAAVTAVLLSLEAEASAAPAAVGTTPTSAWTRSARRGRTIGAPGPGAWGGSVR